MSVDVFTPKELSHISALASQVEDYNRSQHGDESLFAEVILYRSGRDVATLTDAGGLRADASAGALVLEVKVEEKR